jgi:arylsulfatase
MKRLTLLLFLMAAQVLSVSAESLRPNVVILFAADMGYTDVGCFGAEGWKTPYMDQLAAEGMALTNFHVAQAVCSASRAALLSGAYSQRTGILGALFPHSRHGMPEAIVTLPEMLKAEGYATSMVGKWHLGCLPQFFPTRHGFDEWYGLPYSNDMWPVGHDGKPRANSKHPPLPLYDGDAQVAIIEDLSDQDTLTTRYTARAVDFLRRQSSEQPFFLYLAHSMPHIPLGVSDKFRGKSEQGLYGDMMMEFDWSVGQVMQTLDEIGVAENTLIIFTSDNGPWLNFGNHGGTCHGLRQGKGTAFEGGQRVPAIMRWPAVIPAGVRSDSFAATIDLYPTIAGYAGGELPEGQIDGVDIASVLAGDLEAQPRKEFWYYYGKALCGVSDGQWKLVLPHKHRSYEVHEPGKDGMPGKQAQVMAKQGLYNLSNDPGEKNDLSQQYPEIVQGLEQMAARARADLGDTKKKAKK